MPNILARICYVIIYFVCMAGLGLTLRYAVDSMPLIFLGGFITGALFITALWLMVHYLKLQEIARAPASDLFALRVNDETKAQLIQNRSQFEAKLIISVSEQAAIGSLSGRATASEIAALLDKRCTIDPTHMGDREFVQYLEILVRIMAERDFNSNRR